ncbi:tripartite tricarboxylate transporter TctB family protein [Clostridiales bacterium COT073_COT-073]|nr:tripartite tricarboxylate transporter TctB family protein [Clostridiales bacterium COT073_COT-073]
MEIKYRSNLTAGFVSIGLGIICSILVPMQIGVDYALTYGITSRTVPYAVAALWVACGIILIVQSLWLKKDEVKVLRVKQELKAVAYMLVLLVYSLLFKTGFLLSTMFLGVVTLAFTKSKNKLYYVIILILVGALYLLFKEVLQVQMN